MSEVTGERGGSAPSRGLPPVVILLLGLLTTGVCLLLLFGPFYRLDLTPGRMLQGLFIDLLGQRGPYFVRNLLWTQFLPTMAGVFGLFLAVLPWVTARRRHRGDAGAGAGPGSGAPAPRSANGIRVTRTVRSSSISFSDDGRLLDEEHPEAETIERSIPELRVMARAAGIPWHTDYETAGGARAFLEVLRAVHSGPSGVIRTEGPQRAREEAPGASSMVPPSTPSSAPASPQSVTWSAATAAGPLAGASPVASPAIEPAPTLAEAEGKDPDPTGGYRISQPTWSPSFTGSVYTSTDLYRSEPTDPLDPVGPVGSDSSDSADNSDDRAGER